MENVDAILERYIQSLENESSRAALLNKIASEPNAAGTPEAKIEKLIQLAFEHGKVAGVKENRKRIADIARAQLSANSDEQARELTPTIRECVAQGISTLQGVADYLNARSITTKDNNEWYPGSVKILIDRINKVFPDAPISLPKDAFLEKMRPIIEEIKQNGAKTLSEISGTLNNRNIPTSQGNRWHPATVSALLTKLDRSKETHDLGI